ncbi:MAG TPA: GNAT family N-acetyltransferase [Candidatus Limnocylindria bacterium]
MATTAFAIRPATADDADRLSELATQLGYPTTPSELAMRVRALAALPDAAILVATDADDRPIGWIHVGLKPSLLAPLSAQVMGLVVDEARRGVGIGAQLLNRAEAWATDRGCGELLVATRVTRERAHRFYRRHGYELLKTSHIFHKELV